MNKNNKKGIIFVYINIIIKESVTRYFIIRYVTYIYVYVCVCIHVGGMCMDIHMYICICAHIRYYTCIPDDDDDDDDDGNEGDGREA